MGRVLLGVVSLLVSSLLWAGPARAESFVLFPIESLVTMPAEGGGDAELYDALRSVLDASSRISVVDQEQVEDAVRKLWGDGPVCRSRNCQRQLARELSASKILTTRTSRLGDRCAVSSLIVDGASGQVERGATRIGGCSRFALRETFAGVARSLLAQLGTAWGLSASPQDSESDGLEQEDHDASP